MQGHSGRHAKTCCSTLPPSSIQPPFHVVAAFCKYPPNQPPAGLEYQLQGHGMHALSCQNKIPHAHPFTHWYLPTDLPTYVHNSPPLSAHHHSTGKARKQQYHHCMRRVSGRSNRPTDTLSRCATTGNVQDARRKTQRCCVCILCNSLRRPVHTLESRVYT